MYWYGWESVLCEKTSALASNILALLVSKCYEKKEKNKSLPIRVKKWRKQGSKNHVVATKNKCHEYTHIHPNIVMMIWAIADIRARIDTSGVVFLHKYAILKSMRKTS